MNEFRPKSDSIKQVFSGQQPVIVTGTNQSGQPQVILPGSFNPLHAGHRKMAAVSTRLIGHPVSYEISIENVDKPSLTEGELLKRIGQFSATETVAVTRASTFEKKAALFPGVVFAVGIDTLIRMNVPDYHGYAPKEGGKNSPSPLDRMIEEIVNQDCRLLVFGRKIGEQFVGLADLEIHPALSELCQIVPETLFREDISSSVLRSE